MPDSPVVADSSRSWPVFALVVSAALLGYANSLGNGFVWDDHIYISQNPFVQDPGNLRLLFDPRFYARDQEVLGGSRPVLLGSLLVDRALWGARPEGYHLTNLLLHALNGAWVAALAKRLWAPSPWSAALAGMLFVLHPVQTEAVNSVTFRADLLCAFFVFAALWCYLRARLLPRRGFLAWTAASAGLYLLGLLSKEMAATLPLLIALIEYYLLRGRRPSLGMLAAAYALAAGIFLLFWAPRFRYEAIHGPARTAQPARGHLFQPPARAYRFEPSPPPWDALYRDRAAWLRFLPGLYAGYLRLLAVPVGLTVDRAPILPGSWRDWALSAALVLALAGYAVAARRAHPVSAFALAWILVALLPVSGIAPLYNPVAERYLYLVTAGAAWALAAGVDALARAARTRARPAAALAAALLLAPYATRTWARNRDWASDETLFFAQAAAPQSPRVRYNRAFLLEQSGRREEALEEYRAAVAQHPGYSEAWLRLALLYDALKRDGEAEEAYGRAVESGPRTPVPRLRAGIFFERRGDSSLSLRMYEEALEIYPNYQPARLRLGLLRLRQGHRDAGLRLIEEARAGDPALAEIDMEEIRSIGGAGKK